MEKRTAEKARKWQNELSVMRQRRQDQKQPITSGQYIPKQAVETSIQYRDKSINFERLLLYFFVGVIFCIVVWKGIDVLEERYLVDEIKQGTNKLFTYLDEGVAANSALKYSNPNLSSRAKQKRTVKPVTYNPYQTVTTNHLIGNICAKHVKTEVYEKKVIRCKRNTDQCKTIMTTPFTKKSSC